MGNICCPAEPLHVHDGGETYRLLRKHETQQEVEENWRSSWMMSEALDVDEHEPPRVVVGEWRRSGKGVESNPKRKTEGEESEGMESEGGVDLGELITQNRTGEGAEEEVLLMVTSSQLYRVEGNKPTFFLTQEEGEGKSHVWLHSRPDIENYMEENLIQDRYNSLFIRHPHVHFIGEAEGLGLVCISLLVEIEKYKPFARHTSYDNSAPPPSMSSSFNLPFSSSPQIVNRGTANFLIRWKRGDELVQIPLPNISEYQNFSFRSEQINLENKVLAPSVLNHEKLIKLLIRKCIDLQGFTPLRTLVIKEEVVKGVAGVLKGARMEQRPERLSIRESDKEGGGWIGLVESDKEGGGGEDRGLMELCARFCQYEYKILNPLVKVGVLYCANKQTTEKEMYQNTKTSYHFDEFVESLGQKFVADDDNERGGIPKGQTGVQGQWGGFTYIFHVAPLLPCGSEDQERVERKRLVGNDTVVVVYVEGDQPINPEIFRSKVTQVYIFVRSGMFGTYHVQIARKREVEPFDPPLPEDPGIPFLAGPSFRNFLFAKIAKGAHSAHRSPSYSHYWRARQNLLFESLGPYAPVLKES